MSQGGKKVGLHGGDGTEAHFPNPPPLLGRRAGTISRLTRGDYGGSLYLLLLFGGVLMAQKHVLGVVSMGVVLLFKGTMTPGQFWLPCSAPPRPNHGTL